ncbi:MAG: GNAT family N-acetyltransferase [Myxococcales bacterium]
MSGAVLVRELAAEDLRAAGDLCERMRAKDPAVEPFAQRLPIIAEGSRALLDLWRVAQSEDGALQAIAFAAVRESRTPEGAERPVADLYAAVAPELRRQGLGRALSAPALDWAAAQGATLRARVRDGAQPGQAFLRSLGFRETSVQLSLAWSSRPIEATEMPALRIRRLGPGEAMRDLERLSREAWADAPDTFATRSDEVAQLFGEEGRLVLLAEAERRAVAYLSAVRLGATLGIEEVAVLPEFRRMGIGRAVVAAALAGAAHAVLSVAESNAPARALYRSLGFSVSARRLVHELRHG